ncbi:hypothetical protein C8R45DRAFT_1147770 [Mycena sanguinolenta]|nr:hypothetical protein C8R45DRAFT_1147770 [Mycena sanguinolenta]
MVSSRYLLYAAGLRTGHLDSDHAIDCRAIPAASRTSMLLCYVYPPRLESVSLLGGIACAREQRLSPPLFQVGPGMRGQQPPSVDDDGAGFADVAHFTVPFASYGLLCDSGWRRGSSAICIEHEWGGRLAGRAGGKRGKALRVKLKGIPARLARFLFDKGIGRQGINLCDSLLNRFLFLVYTTLSQPRHRRHPTLIISRSSRNAHIHGDDGRITIARSQINSPQTRLKFSNSHAGYPSDDDFSKYRWIPRRDDCSRRRRSNGTGAQTWMCITAMSRHLPWDTGTLPGFSQTYTLEQIFNEIKSFRLGYTEERPYPWRWTTPIMLCAFLLISPFLALVNVPLSAYNIVQEFTYQPNDTLPSVLLGNLVPSILQNPTPDFTPQLLSIRDAIRLDEYIFNYIIAQAFDGANATNLVSAFPYYNNPLSDSCDVANITVQFTLTENTEDEAGVSIRDWNTAVQVSLRINQLLFQQQINKKHPQARPFRTYSKPSEGLLWQHASHGSGGVLVMWAPNREPMCGGSGFESHP